ncbi:uncharacterized protein L201_006011 [Kwoniella dendrophila CBS 6074]|uniref:Alpha/beta hydrolase fold-3 domain-containing protein n=1 Tax=Kwoniella dendrophila CBS 6074 TaxID=1295534 RepID=A0AAX4K2T3_9TREE
MGKRPWVFWIHGGAWIYGQHYHPNPWVIPAFRSLSYHIVSITYRFIPQVGVDEISSDTSLAYEWCKKNLGSILGEDNIDLGNYISAGESAGGSLCLWSGNHFKPKPKVVLTLYATSFFDDPYYSKPFERMTLPNFGTSEFKIVNVLMKDTNNPKNAVVTNPYTLDLPSFKSIEDLALYLGLDLNDNYHQNFFNKNKIEKFFERSDFNLYLWKNGISQSIIFRKKYFDENPQIEYGYGYQREMEKLSAMYFIKDNEFDYPPTILIHGKKDNAVPLHQSTNLGKKLKKMNIPLKEIYVQGKKHMFDVNISGPEDPLWDVVVVPVIQFVKDHIEVTQPRVVVDKPYRQARL